MLNEMIGSGIIRGAMGASFGIFIICGMLSYMEARHACDLKKEIKAARFMIASVILCSIATMALVLVQ